MNAARGINSFLRGAYLVHLGQRLYKGGWNRHSPINTLAAFLQAFENEDAFCLTYGDGLGNVNIGKSFFQRYINTMLIGGRFCDPLQFIHKETTFNEDGLGSESHVIDDAGECKDLRSRNWMKEAFKQYVGNDSHPIRPGASVCSVHT